MPGRGRRPTPVALQLQVVLDVRHHGQQADGRARPAPPRPARVPRRTSSSVDAHPLGAEGLQHRERALHVVRRPLEQAPAPGRSNSSCAHLLAAGHLRPASAHGEGSSGASSIGLLGQPLRPASRPVKKARDLLLTRSGRRTPASRGPAQARCSASSARDGVRRSGPTAWRRTTPRPTGESCDGLLAPAATGARSGRRRRRWRASRAAAVLPLARGGRRSRASARSTSSPTVVHGDDLVARPSSPSTAVRPPTWRVTNRANRDAGQRQHPAGRGETDLHREGPSSRRAARSPRTSAPRRPPGRRGRPRRG